jgi:hypothetical protein
MSGSGTSLDVDVGCEWSFELQAQISPSTNVNRRNGCLMSDFRMAGNNYYQNSHQ